MTGLEQQLTEVMTMPPAQLRSLWRDIYRSPAPDIGPDLLRRGIANRLQERVHDKLPNATRREIDRLRKRVERTGKADHMHAISLTHLLQNPVYVGKMKHKENVYDGAHQSSIAQELFDLVQSNFQANRRTNALGKKSRNPSLLTGIITDPDGKPMTPTHATKGSKRFRYYVTRTLPGDQSIKWRMPAGEIERLVVDTVARQIACIDSSGDETAAQLSEQLNQRRDIANALPDMSIREQRRILLGRQTRVEVHEAVIKIGSNPTDEDELSSISVKAKLVSKGSDLKLAIAPDQGPPRRDPDPVLLRLIARAFAAQDLLLAGKPSPMIAEYGPRHLQQLTRLSYLAPDIITAIVDGTQPVDLTGRKILRIGNVPLCWAAQRKLFSFN